MGGRNSVGGIATLYGLGGLGFELRWGLGIPHPSRTALSPIQPPVQWVPDFLPGVKRSGRSVGNAPTSSAEVKERVSYTFTPSWPSWHVTGRTYPLLVYFVSHSDQQLLSYIIVKKLRDGQIYTTNERKEKYNLQNDIQI